MRDNLRKVIEYLKESELDHYLAEPSKDHIYLIVKELEKELEEDKKTQILKALKDSEREDKARVLDLDYFSMTEANVEIEWFDNEKDEWVKLRGLIEEVQDE